MVHRSVVKQDTRIDSVSVYHPRSILWNGGVFFGGEKLLTARCKSLFPGLNTTLWIRFCTREKIVESGPTSFWWNVQNRNTGWSRKRKAKRRGLISRERKNREIGSTFLWLGLQNRKKKSTRHSSGRIRKIRTHRVNLSFYLIRWGSSRDSSSPCETKNRIEWC